MSKNKLDLQESGAEFGRFTTDLSAALLLGKNSCPFTVLVFGKNDGTCTMCCQADQMVFNKEDFQNWSRDNRVPLVFAPYERGEKNQLVKWVRTSFPDIKAFPSAIVLDSASSQENPRALGFIQVVSYNKEVNGLKANPFCPATVCRQLQSFKEDWPWK